LAGLDGLRGLDGVREEKEERYLDSKKTMLCRALVPWLIITRDRTVEWADGLYIIRRVVGHGSKAG
jgi:hypothetical protein